ncbi:MAG: ATP phosphoribosyltransferase regulatory subunit [Pseudohongiellaceae bacterium]
MNTAKRWLLPDGVEDILPDEAHKLESLRRRILDLYASWGYQLIITPLVEYLDSLLVGTSHDLDLHTFKITDQLSGRMLGVRADITPQAARIDAHGLNYQGPARLCYADSVLHTRPGGLLTSRIPIRAGAELFGHDSVACDIELICLMHATMEEAAVEDVTMVLGHVGLFRTLLAAAQLPAEVEAELFEAVQRKAFDDIDGIVHKSVSNKKLAGVLGQLVRLSGGEEVLETAGNLFAAAPKEAKQELAELTAIVAGVKQRLPDIRLGFDLCELRGYQYHTGIVFAAYTPAYGRALAQGGRYDHIGQVFGRARPASGFDSDLKVLNKLSASGADSNPDREASRPCAILAPDNADPALMKLIAKLRAAGEVVITDLGNETVTAGQFTQELNCDRQITMQDGNWVVVSP